MAQSEREALLERLGRYPVDRYPVQHATTRFHLGSVLLHAGDSEPAVQELSLARQVFDRAGMALEAAKAAVMLGIALRSAGRPAEAEKTFTDTLRLLAPLHRPAEQGAAAHNLGLVRRDLGDLDGARQAWSSAHALFLEAGLSSHAAAAARESGAALLAAGDAAAARPLLQDAAALAERAGDDAGTAAAGNALGLAHLACGDAPAAVEVLRRALGFAPRTVRPAEHAMLKSNLALAHEQAGSAARARLAARQALAVTGSAPPVRTQAQQLLARLPGAAHEDLLAVLDETDREQAVPVLREELVRAAQAPPAERRALLRGFLTGVLARPDRSYELAQGLLAAVLELPPRPYEDLLSAVVEATGELPHEDAQRVRTVVASALARFAMPQWQRAVASLNAAALEAGQPATWR